MAGLLTTDYEDIVYTVTVEGTTGNQYPDFDPVPANTTVWGAVTFTASEGFTLAGTVTGVTDQYTFAARFDNGPDSREVANWFKYGAVTWETGNNGGGLALSMEVKISEPAVSTGIITMGVTDTNTFNRSAGSFATDGFSPGMTITTTGFTDVANNGTFTVLGVGTLALDIVETTLVAESGTANELMNSHERISLFLSMPFVIQAGDQFSIYAGCDTRLDTCIEKFDNTLNMRAEPYLPGQDAFSAVQPSR